MNDVWKRDGGMKECKRRRHLLSGYGYRSTDLVKVHVLLNVTSVTE